MTIKTSDLGYAIRDHLEGKAVFPLNSAGASNDEPSSSIEAVSVDDPHNPVIFMSTGERFIVRIFRG